MTWEIFIQEDIKLNPKEVKQIQLGLEFIMSEGVVLASLSNSLKFKHCKLQNEVSLEDAEDIVITLMNNLNEVVNIQASELLCRVCYEQEGHDGPVSLHWLIREIHSYQTLHYLGIGLKHKTPYKD